LDCAICSESEGGSDTAVLLLSIGSKSVSCDTLLIGIYNSNIEDSIANTKIKLITAAVESLGLYDEKYLPLILLD
jgi:hypothetical protein